MRPLVISLLVLALLATAPSSGWLQGLGELYRKATPSGAVIRARGKEVSTGGVVRFGEIGSGVLVSPDGKVVTASEGGSSPR